MSSLTQDDVIVVSAVRTPFSRFDGLLKSTDSIDLGVLALKEVVERWVTPGRTLTESDIVNYAGLTGDWHPLHTDADYARRTPLGERIAHGLLVIAMGNALIFRLGENVVVPETFIAFYGMDVVRFLGPEKIGDTLHCEVEVASMEPKDEKQGLLVYTNVIKNQRGEDVVVFTTRALVGKCAPGPEH